MKTTISASEKLWYQIQEAIYEQPVSWLFEAILCAEFGFRRGGYLDSQLRLRKNVGIKVETRYDVLRRSMVEALADIVMTHIEETDTWDLSLNRVYVDREEYYFIPTKEKL